MRIEFYKHNIDEEDIAASVSVLRSIFLTTSSVTHTFEENFSKYVEAPFAVAVSSCTAALHLSLLALGIGPGDEVITSPLSFVATANAILHAGATPVFVDVERATGNIDAARIVEKITNRTKAIIPVHLYGNMADMKKIKEIGDKYNLKIIEDAAHCIEGQREGTRPGQLSDTACFSFYATKNITSGEGGAIICRDGRLADNLGMLSLHGIDKSAADRYTKKYEHWNMKLLGWKYNISDIQSAVLIGQLERIDKLRERRKEIAQFYEKAFDLAGIEYIRVPSTVKPAYHLFTILVEQRDEVLHGLQESGIGVAVHYRPIHLHSYYRNSFGYREGDFPIAEYIGKRTISIPLYPKLTDKEIDYVINTIKEIL